MYEIEKTDGPIRVLHVIGSMDRGGAETMIMNIFRVIDRSKIQFDFLLSTNHEGQFDSEIRSLGGRIYYIPRFNGTNIVAYYRDCIAFFKNHPEYKIVHGHIGSSAALYLLAAKKSGCFAIAHSHNGKSKRSIRSIMYSLYSYPTRYIADHLFGCSTEAGIARYGRKAVNSDKYSNFYNGIALDSFYFQEEKRRKIRDQLHIPYGAIVIGTVGRITEQKNPEKILHIFIDLVQKHPNCICLWVGTGPDETKIKEAIVISKHKEKIRLLGVRKDVPELLCTFDCFVFPSLWEGLPVTLIEAQASGLPIVLSDTISKEVEISPLLTWLSVSASDEDWAEKCYKSAGDSLQHRCDYVDLINKSEYNVANTSKHLCHFYLSSIN